MAFDHATFRSNITALQGTLATLQTQMEAIEGQIQAHIDDPGEDEAEVAFTLPLRSILQRVLAEYGPRPAGGQYRSLEELGDELQARFDESTDISP